jgi:hypothetical protein
MAAQHARVMNHPDGNDPAMKYLFTVVAALLLGSGSFHLAEYFSWKRWRERLLILFAATVAAARICARAWL